jgi:hypothetical protein
MKKEYDLAKMKRRPGPVKVIPESELKFMISIRLDGNDIGDLKREALRLGIPYQTLIGSILHRYITGDLIDVKEAQKLAKK